MLVECCDALFHSCSHTVNYGAFIGEFLSREVCSALTRITLMKMNATGIISMTIASTLVWLSRMNVTHNDTSSSIRNNMTKLSAILWDYYDKIYGDSDYFLVVLYVPVMAIAVIANILVIAVVFKYHYMRRYV